MCGIAGVISRYPDCLPTVTIAKACIDALRHRGPDGFGFWSDRLALLMHTRLAILDLDGGHQPMTNEDGTIVVTFNGEIYNSPELRIYLQNKGHVFRSKTDTEVLVHLYEEQGIAMLARLRGMFAFAIWDSGRKCLFLARDRLGIKPLYYAILKDKFLFASLPAAILATGMLPPNMEVTSIPGLLYFGCLPPWRCAYVHIHKLPPAHYMHLEVNTWTFSIQRYWKPPSETLNLDHEEAIEQVRERIGEAVEAHLLSDVPLGVALSGGLDSSIIAHHAVSAYRKSLVGFTIDWDLHKHREGECMRAQQTANRLAIKHLRLDPPTITDCPLDNVVQTLDEPLGDSAFLPLYSLCAQARALVKILLTGDGGDEIFAGYRRYATNRLEQLLGDKLKGMIGMLRHIPTLKSLCNASHSKFRKIGRAIHRLCLDDGTAYATSIGQAPLGLIDSWLAPDLRTVLLEDLEQLSCLWYESPLRHPLRRMAYVDLHFLLPEAFLVKVDRASMAVGLEIRPPLLDHLLVEWAWMIPPNYKLQYLTTKLLLRRAYRRLLPDTIIHAPKQGFELRGLVQQVRAILPQLSEYLSSSPWKHILIPAAIAQAITQFERNYTEYAQPLWNLYCLLRWHDYWISRN